MDKKDERKIEEARELAVFKELTPMPFEELDRTINNWLTIADFGVVKFVLAAIVANRLPGNSVWVYLVGTSGAGKSEIIQGLNDIPFIYTLSNLTPTTFISGMKGVDGLLWELKGKVLAMKDFTTILDMNQDARSEIMSQLREIYDQYYEKGFGNGDIKRWDGKVGFITGVTPVIDTREAAYSALGERFIKYRIIPPDRITIANKALDNTTKTEVMQTDIRTAFARCMAGVEKILATGEETVLSDEQKKQLILLANFATTCRSPITRESGMAKDVIHKPGLEMPTRFTQQLSQIAIALKIINRASGHGDVLLADDMKIIFKIALDSIPSTRREVLKRLAENVSVKTDEMANLTSYPTNTIKRYLEDLFMLGVCTRRHSGTKETGTYVWELKDEWREIMEEYDGVKMMTEEERLVEEAEARQVKDIFMQEEINKSDLPFPTQEEIEGRHEDPDVVV